MPQEDPRILELREKRAKAMQGGGEDRIAKQHAKGKQTARERIDLLLDSGSFQEIDTFMVSQVEDAEKFAGDGVVTGYGLVDGLMVYVYAQDFTVLGGALGEMQGRKICQVMDMAVKSGVPIIGLIDSGGARIQEGVHSLSGYAEIFRRNAQYSGIIPQISLVLGPCAGGASYSPALTDLIIMVEKQSYMFLTGPEVIKSVTGEVIDSETLGGATTHLTHSGLASLTCPDEQSALDLCRRILGYLPPNHVERPPSIESADDIFRMDDSLNTIVPFNPAEAYSMHEVVEKVVDQGSWLEIQAGFADNALVGLARLGGIPVGILAQEPNVKAGCIDMDAADKMTRFVRFCDCYNLPLVTFVDSPGFLPGVEQEHRGIIRHGAKLLYAYSEATAPKISIVTRKAYGGAYIVMNSKPLGADLAFAWPSAEIAVMGAEGAANILYRRQIDAAPDPAAERARLVEEYRQRFLSPYAAAGMGYIDEVIEPRETRARLITALTVLRDKAVTVLPKRHGNMPV
jgi:propionyl-CoA carboxylase beta chain